MEKKTYTLNTMQMLAVTGIIISLVAQLALLITGKQINNFWAVYPTWIGVFAVGSAFKHFGPAAQHEHGDEHHH